MSPAAAVPKGGQLGHPSRSYRALVFGRGRPQTGPTSPTECEPVSVLGIGRVVLRLGPGEEQASGLLAPTLTEG